MDAVIFAFSFIFSFVFIIIGYWKESSVLEIIGSLSLLLTGIFLGTTQIQTTAVQFYQNSSMINSTLISKTYSYGSESAFPVGLMFSVFAIMNLLYSGYMILEQRRG